MGFFAQIFLASLLLSQTSVASISETHFSSVTTYEYDAAGNIVRITDAEDHLTQISFNPRNQPEQTTHADNSITQQAFNGTGNVYLVTDELNQRVCGAFDGEGGEFKFQVHHLKLS